MRRRKGHPSCCSGGRRQPADVPTRLDALIVNSNLSSVYNREQVLWRQCEELAVKELFGGNFEVLPNVDRRQRVETARNNAIVWN